MFNRDIDTIKGSNQELQWLIVGSFRYAVDRHGTQCMWGIEKVIKDNIDILNDGFIEQFIEAIQNEQRIERISREYDQKEKNNFWYRLRAHLKDYISYLKDEPSAGAQEAYVLCNKLMELTEKVKIEKFKYTPWRNIEDTSYLNPLLEFLQKEYERRGYRRIEPRD